MIQTSSIKFYLAKYSLLAFSIGQWLLATIIFFRVRNFAEAILWSMIPTSLGLILYSMFILIKNRLKRVAVGKNKIIISEGSRYFRFEWPEIKSIRNIPFLNLYKLRLRGLKKSIYFFPKKKLDEVIQLPA